MTRFKCFALPSAALNVSLFLLLSMSMLIVLTGGVVTVASAQGANDTAFAKTNKSKLKDITASRKQVNFGKRPPNAPSASQIITIHNPNSIAVDVSFISSSNGQFVASHDCVTSLAADGRCDISIVFTPLSDGKKSANLTISSASGKSLRIAMTGEGKGAPVPTSTPTATVAPT